MHKNRVINSRTSNRRHAISKDILVIGNHTYIQIVLKGAMAALPAVISKVVMTS